MKINLSPLRSDKVFAVSRAGDVLTIDGEAFDFSSLPDGGLIPSGMVPCPWIEGAVRRVDGEIDLTLILPHGPAPSHVVAFPAPIVNPPDGLVALPHDEEPA